MQKWEGNVHQVDRFAGEFTAILRDITDPNNGDEICTLQITDMPEADQDRIQPGLVFNWTIEVDDQGNGKSTFKFSQEKWTAEEIAQIEKDAKENWERLNQ